MSREAKPILCYVTDRRALRGSGADAVDALQQRILRAIRFPPLPSGAPGVDWIQIREKDLPARQLVELVRTAVAAAQAPSGTPPAARRTGPRILVNDRLDVAFAARAGGVHLGHESLPVVEVARWRTARFDTPQDFLVGASCHSIEEAQEAERDGADYVYFGPVFATPSKDAFGPPQGVERLAAVCRSVRIPVLALGGITLNNAAECLRAGAAGIAAIRLFQESTDLAAVVAQLRSPC